MIFNLNDGPVSAKLRVAHWGKNQRPIESGDDDDDGKA